MVEFCRTHPEDPGCAALLARYESGKEKSRRFSAEALERGEKPLEDVRFKRFWSNWAPSPENDWQTFSGWLVVATTDYYGGDRQTVWTDGKTVLVQTEMGLDVYDHPIQYWEVYDIDKIPPYCRHGNALGVEGINSSAVRWANVTGQIRLEGRVPPSRKSSPDWYTQESSLGRWLEEGEVDIKDISDLIAYGEWWGVPVLMYLLRDVNEFIGWHHDKGLEKAQWATSLIEALAATGWVTVAELRWGNEAITLGTQVWQFLRSRAEKSDFSEEAGDIFSRVLTALEKMMPLLPEGVPHDILYAGREVRRWAKNLQKASL